MKVRRAIVPFVGGLVLGARLGRRGPGKAEKT